MAARLYRAACLLVATASLLVAGGLSPLVRTEYGPVEGFLHSSADGNAADVFLGIPFAQPPVGQLRFEKPVPPTSWSEPLAASEMRDACYSAVILPTPWNHSEDCLYLNVIAPPKAENGELHPVVVVIHGGGFIFGSAHFYADLDDLIKNFISKGIVVVTIQYRLTLFGFVSDGEDSLKGNYGLWDQQVALKFVHNNIRQFGGDPQQITLYGCSAGGASVSALTYSPHSRDLFSRAIQSSGSILGHWAANDLTAQQTAALAEALRCKGNAVAVKECMKRATVEELYKALQIIDMPPTSTTFGMFVPRVDGDFFPKEFDELIADAPKKPTIIGLTEEEQALFVFTFAGNSVVLTNTGVPKDRIEHFTKADWQERIRQLVATPALLGENAEKAAKDIVRYYVSETETATKGERHRNVFLRKYVQMLSDLAFNIPVLRETVDKTKAGWPMHLYIFSHAHAQEWLPEGFRGMSTHGDDHNYVFQGKNHMGHFTYRNFTEDDLRVSKLFTDVIVQFVKTGTVSSVHWPTTSARHPLQHLRIENPPKVEEALWKERLDFWNSMTERYGVDIVRHVAAKVVEDVKEEL